MNYKFLIAAITVVAFTACSEGRKTPDGYEMDNPPPSAYAPSDYETFDQDDYDVTSEGEAEIFEEDAVDAVDEVDDVVVEAEDDGIEESDEADEVDEEEEE